MYILSLLWCLYESYFVEFQVVLYVEMCGFFSYALQCILNL